ncbi:MAG: tetratricopeptide repeat protein, partial [Gammaproteobacteria bacterium]
MLSSHDSLTFAPFERRQSPRPGLVCLLAAWLAGCATSQVPPGPGTQAVMDPSASAVAAAPRIDLTGEMLYTLLVAEIAGQRGHPEIAVENYLAIARTVADAGVAERATRIAIFAKREHDALEAAELWVARAGDDPDARRVLAALLIRGGRLDEALKHLEIVTDSDDEQASHNLRLIANILSTEKDQAAALKVMERLVARRQDDPQALFAYAWLALRADEVQVARETVERALRLPPFDTNMAVAYLGILQKQGDVQTALTWIEGAVKEHPEDFHLRMAYGRLLADNKRFDAARDQFEILAKEQPDNSDVRFALGLLYLQGQDLAKAEQSFLRIARSGQYTQDARYYLGQIAEAKKDYGSAVHWYSSVEDGPNHFDAQLSIALALVKGGNVKDAERHLATIKPANEQQRIKAIRIAGEILTHQGRYTEAMKLYDQVLARGYDSELLYTRAMLAD